MLETRDLRTGVSHFGGLGEPPRDQRKRFDELLAVALGQRSQHVVVDARDDLAAAVDELLARPG